MCTIRSAAPASGASVSGLVEVSGEQANAGCGEHRVRRAHERGDVVALEPVRERAPRHVAAADNEKTFQCHSRILPFAP